MKLYHILTKILVLTAISTISLSQDDFSDSADGAKEITVSGLVSDAETGKPLAGANIIVVGSDLGSATDENGEYTLENILAGSEISASVIGYEDLTLYADSENLNFSLVAIALEMTPLEVLASRAGENTAVAYTNIDKEELNLRLASQDIPLALNTVPSVYSTGQGGGAGDSRINVRGFNQRNIAIMLNGIPVNDMENGWVYWSNWDGVADATSSIQVQKGLSAVNLATPSIGGSMNIITDPSSQERRGMFKQELGAWGFLKTTASFHSGLLMDDKLALSGTLVRKVGEGHSDGTWTDAYAYFLDASYSPNENHRFQFYALGAPQRHGQNRYRQNIATYDSKYAKDLDTYDQSALGENGGKFSEVGREFNQNFAAISEESQSILDASSGQYFRMYTVFDGVDRHEKGGLSERENFFHKPQVALNHFWTINDDMMLASSVYWSGGMGGGTGHYGSIDRNPAVEGNAWYASSPWTWNYDKTIAYNDTSSSGSKGILRNSNNRQSTVGVLSKFNYRVNSNIKTQFGIDARSAQIYHVKTIRDLLGGEYFVNNDSEFDAPNTQKGLGDAIDYNFTNTVGWLGLFAQAEYNSGPLTAYGMFGTTTVKYTYQDHFKMASNYDYSYAQSKDGSDLDWVVANGKDEFGGNAGELYIEADPITTMQLKGGALYELGDAFSFLGSIPIFGKTYENANIWANFGLVDKAPVFDQVIQDWTGQMATDPQNESFSAFELGLDFYSNDGSMAGALNLYSTQWKDRVQTKNVQDQGDSSDDIIVYLTGIDQSHSGIEAELSAQVSEMVRLDFGLGYGKWVFTDDASGSYRDGDVDQNYSYALKDLRVGDMPQTNFIFGATLTPLEGLKLNVLSRTYMSYYSDWNVSSREYDSGSNPDRKQSWIAPDYTIIDLHASYDLPVSIGTAKPQLFLHVLNALDAVYIQDATDNSRYNGNSSDHYASDAEVFFGLPTSFNLGLNISF